MNLFLKEKKNMKKNLSLKKVTLANLDRDPRLKPHEMNELKGGTIPLTTLCWSLISCPTMGDFCQSVRESCYGQLCPQLPNQMNRNE
jgi:hypothetical protein